MSCSVTFARNIMGADARYLPLVVSHFLSKFLFSNSHFFLRAGGMGFLYFIAIQMRHHIARCDNFHSVGFSL
jgi:hypothetical protein